MLRPLRNFQAVVYNPKRMRRSSVPWREQPQNTGPDASPPPQPSSSHSRGSAATETLDLPITSELLKLGTPASAFQVSSLVLCLQPD